MSTVLSTNQFKNGNHIEVDGTVFKVLEFQHVKPGKGGAFVRTKLRRAADGAVIDKTFRAGEKFRAVRTETRKMQFLYADGTDAHFMDSQSFDQLTLPEEGVGDALRWIRPSEEIDLLFIDDRPTDINVPSAVELEVSQTEPGDQGRHRLRRRDQAGDARDRRGGPGAALHQRGRARAGGHPRRARTSRAPRSCASASSGARRSSRSTNTTSPDGRWTSSSPRDARPYTRGLAHATLDFQDELDEAIARHATGWSLDRIAPLERAILRTATLEILHPEVTTADTPIPPEGAIDEAVETAKKFCGTDAPGFVNGVLAAILRAKRENRAAHG